MYKLYCIHFRLPHCTVDSVEVYGVQLIQCTLYTLYCMHYTVDSVCVQCTLYTFYCKHCTLFKLCCIHFRLLLCPLFKLYSIHFRLLCCTVDSVEVYTV